MQYILMFLFFSSPIGIFLWCITAGRKLAQREGFQEALGLLEKSRAELKSSVLKKYTSPVPKSEGEKKENARILVIRSMAIEDALQGAISALQQKRNEKYGDN